MARSVRLSAPHPGLADPVRLRLLDALAAGAASAADLARAVGVPPAEAEAHLAALVDAGLVRRRGEPGRPRYEARRDPGDAAEPADPAVFLGSVFEATRADLLDALRAGADPGRDLHPPRAVLRRGRILVSPAEVDELLERMAALLAEYAAPPDGGPRLPVGFLVALYEQRGPAGRG